MSSKKLIIPAFVLMIFAQLIVPGKMIWDREVVLISGKSFKFRTEPIDPNDPFRGKYMTLNYINDWAPVDSKEDWTSGQTVYAILGTDEEGFVRFTSVSKIKPKGDVDFLKTKVGSMYRFGDHKMEIDLPFDRFYMDENKAPEAENIYFESQADTTSVAYGLVVIKGGAAVLKDVLIDEVSVRELVRERTEGD